MKKLQKKGIVYMSITVLCWSFIEILGGLVYLGGGSPVTLLQVRYLLASLLFFLTILVCKNISFKVKRKDIFRIVLSGLFLASHLLLFWFGFKEVVSVLTMLAIYFTYPAILAVVSSIFAKERFTNYRKISLLLCSVGVALTIGLLPSLNLVPASLFGIALLFAAVICWVIYLLMSKKITKEYSLYTLLFYNFSIATVVFLFMQNPLVTISELTPNIIIYLVLMGVFSTYVAYIFMQKAIKYIGASCTGIIHLSKTTFSIILAYLVLNQAASMNQLIGIGLVLSGVYILSREKNN